MARRAATKTVPVVEAPAADYSPGNNVAASTAADEPVGTPALLTGADLHEKGWRFVLATEPDGWIELRHPRLSYQRQEPTVARAVTVARELQEGYDRADSLTTQTDQQIAPRIAGVPTETPSPVDSLQPLQRSGRAATSFRSGRGNQGEFKMIEVGMLTRSPWNPRTRFDKQGDDGLDSLADSIKQHGILEPLVVRPSSRPLVVGWELIAGERRLRAAKMVGLTEVPCIVREMDDRTAKVATAIENLQRKQLDPFDEANCYKILTEEGMKQTEIARQVGYSQSRIAKVTGLLKLPELVQNLIREGKLSAAHGERLLPWAKWPEACETIAQYAAEKGLSVKQIEKPGDFEWGLNDLLKKLPSVRNLGYSYGADTQPEECKKCRFDARRKIGYDYVCFYADHYDAITAEKRAAEQAEQDRLRAEALAAEERRLQKRQQAITAASQNVAAPDGTPVSRVPAEASGECGQDSTEEAGEKAVPVPLPMAPKIPRLSQIGHGNYVLLKPDKLPEGCGADCSCRGAAEDGNKKIVPVCLDPKRYEVLAERERQRQKQARREETDQWLATILPALDWQKKEADNVLPHVTALLIVDALSRLGAHDDQTELLEVACRRHAVHVEGKELVRLSTSYGDTAEKIKETLRQALLRLDAMSQLLFFAEVHLRVKLDFYGRYGNSNSTSYTALTERLLDALPAPPPTETQPAHSGDIAHPVGAPEIQRIPEGQEFVPDGPVSLFDRLKDTLKDVCPEPGQPDGVSDDLPLPPGQKSTWFQWCHYAYHPHTEHKGLAWLAYKHGWTGGEFSNGHKGKLSLAEFADEQVAALFGGEATP